MAAWGFACSRTSGGDHRIPREDVRGGDPYSAIEHIWKSFKTPYESDPRYAELTPGQRSVYALEWAQAEIDNGGFAQFFTNSTGFFAADLPGAARRVGLDRHAQLFSRANALFPEGRVSRDRETRERQFDSASDRLGERMDATLEELDDRFYDMEDEFDRALERYVDAHPDEFFR